MKLIGYGGNTKSNTVNYILDYWKIRISRNTFWSGSWKRIICLLCKLGELETIGWGCLWLNWESPVLGGPKNVEWSPQRAGLGRKMEEKSWKTLFCHRNELGLCFLNCILVNQERLLQQLSISIFWKQFYINIITYSNVMIHEWVVGQYLQRHDNKNYCQILLIAFSFYLLHD